MASGVSRMHERIMSSNALSSCLSGIYYFIEDIETDILLSVLPLKSKLFKRMPAILFLEKEREINTEQILYVVPQCKLSPGLLGNY